MKKSLKKILNENLADLVASQAPQEEAPRLDISLDEKIDHFLVQYEREAVPMAQQFQPTAESKKMSLKYLMRNLFEADGQDDPTADQGDDAGNDVSGGGLDLGGNLGGGGSSGGGGLDLGGGGNSSGGGGGGGNVEKTPVIPTPKINIAMYSKSVARLINDYQSLIDPKRVILNRARAYIEKNYNEKIAQQFLSILDTEFNISPESFEDQNTETPVPIAIGALEPIG